MTQSNPLQTEDTNKKNRAFPVAAIILASLGAVLVTFFIIALRTKAWQVYGILTLIGFMSAFNINGLRLIRNGQHEKGMRQVLSGLLIFLPIVTLLISGLGVSMGLVLVLTLYVYSSQTLPVKDVRRILYTSLGLGAFMAVTDFLPLDYRLLVPEAQTLTPILSGIILLIIAVLVVRQAWTRSYTVGRKLLIAFGLLGLLTLAVGIFANFGLSIVTNAYDHALEDGGELRAISLTLSNDLLTARRHEKDFLARWTEQGFDTAYQNYVIPNQGSVAAMLQHINSMSSFAPTVGETFPETYTQVQYQADLGILRDSVSIYEQEFQNTVSLIEEKGFQDTGLEGEFRDAVHDIEDRIYDVEGLEPLVITMLQIRRHEKDYLLRGDQTYIDQTHESVAELKQQISASEQLDASEKSQMRLLADQYVVAFDKLVENNIQIAAAIQGFRDAAHTMEPIVEKLANTGQEMSSIDASTANTADIQMRTLLTVGMVVALLVAGFLTVFLSRQISRPVVALTNTAQVIAGGQFDVQADVTSADEIGTLAETFNTMTKRLGEAFEDVRRRAAELSTVAEVSTATSTILESKQLLQNVVDLTKERFNLYHSHIYLLDEQGENLVLTAGAGEPGRIMVSEGRTIPLSLEQSLVARAARERQGVTVNDVTQAPDHLPNPLLPDTRSELAVPMIVGGSVIGVFDIQSEQVGRFTDTDVNIQTTLAAQLATSIQNVRSFERSKKEAELQSLVNVIGSRIQRTTTIEETLQTAIRELGTAIGASRVKAKVGQTNGSSNPTAAD